MAADQQHHWLVTVALVTSSLIALIANLLLLVVFCRRRGLRTISNRFTINLLLTNLLSSILLIPLLIADQELTSFSTTTSNSNTTNIIFQEETLEDKNNVVISDLIITTNESDNIDEDIAYPQVSHILCYAAQSIVGLMCTASILSILLVGIDQYFAVIHSLRYHFYIDKFKSLALIITSWIISIVFSVFGALTQSESHIWQFCTTSSLNSNSTTSLSSVYALSYFIFVILVPFLAICVIYVCIYTAAHNNSERMRRSKGNSHCNLDGCMGIRTEQKAPSESRLDLQGTELDNTIEQQQQQRSLPKVHSAPNFINLLQEQQPTPSATPNRVTRAHSDRIGFITNLKCKLSNASVFRYREETRAAKISILVIFMVLVCYIPYGIAVLLNSNAIGVSTTPVINFIALVLLILSNIISPFLFAYRNRRIRRELLRFLGCTLSKNVTGTTIRRCSIRPKLDNRIIEEENERSTEPVQPFLLNKQTTVPQVVVTCKLENEQTERTSSSILKRVCSAKNWPSYKKCSFITVPESCWQTDSARGSFSSASTQMSADE